MKVAFVKLPENLQGPHEGVLEIADWSPSTDGSLPRLGEAVAVDNEAEALIVVSVIHDFRKGHEGPDITIGLLPPGRASQVVNQARERGGAPL